MSYIYLIRSGQTDLYKIGKASNPLCRLDALQTGNGEQLRLLCLSTLRSEPYFHKLFRFQRKRGEWFKFGDDYMNEFVIPQFLDRNLDKLSADSYRAKLIRDLRILLLQVFFHVETNLFRSWLEDIIEKVNAQGEIKQLEFLCHNLSCAKLLFHKEKKGTAGSKVNKSRIKRKVLKSLPFFFSGGESDPLSDASLKTYFFTQSFELELAKDNFIEKFEQFTYKLKEFVFEGEVKFAYFPLQNTVLYELFGDKNSQRSLFNKYSESVPQIALIYNEALHEKDVTIFVEKITQIVFLILSHHSEKISIDDIECICNSMGITFLQDKKGCLLEIAKQMVMDDNHKYFLNKLFEFFESNKTDDLIELLSLIRADFDLTNIASELGIHSSSNANASFSFVKTIFTPKEKEKTPSEIEHIKLKRKAFNRLMKIQNDKLDSCKEPDPNYFDHMKSLSEILKFMREC